MPAAVASDTMDRRAFLKGLTASASVATGSVSLHLVANEHPGGDGTRSYRSPDWLRYCRGVYFEGSTPPIYPHIKDFDANRLIETVKRLGGDTIRFEPVGVWAYYPSKILPNCPELAGRDLIDEVSRECRQSGIHQYCYTPYGNPSTVINAEYADKHPKYRNWILRGPDGKPYGTYPIIWSNVRGEGQRTCTTGDGYRAMYRGIVQELCEHDIDGIYFDAPCGYRGICFCESCRTNFEKFSDIDMDRLDGFAQYNGLPLNWTTLPPNTDMDALIAWFDWANSLVEQDLLNFREIIHRSGKFMLCHNGTTWEGTSLPLQYRIPDGFMLEQSAQAFHLMFNGLMDGSMARPYKKLAQVYMGENTLCRYVPERRLRTFHDTDLEDEDEVRMQGFVELACGNSPIYATANRAYYGIGDGSLEPAQDVFAVMETSGDILKDSAPVPYVSIVPTWESLQLWRTRRQSLNLDMSKAFTLAMLDERISFDVNPSTEISDEWLGRQKVIALCGASGISDAQAKLLDNWVAGGGGLLATYDTGLYNEKGELRSDGGALRNILGVEMQGEPLESQPECYYRVLIPDPAIDGLGKGKLVAGDPRIVPVEATGGARVLADCWNLGTSVSRGPAIIGHEHGRGRTLYVSGSLEEYYAAGRMRSARKLLGGMIRYLGRDAPAPFTLEAPRGVYGVLRRTVYDDRVLFVLANVGFKDADVGWMRQEYLPISNVQIGLLVPEGRKVKSAELIRAKTNLPLTVDGRYARATIPSVHIAEIVYWRFEKIG